MSLSRPVKFPLLKLPWLCIKCVFHNSDEFFLICFATISNRARRIAKSSMNPLELIDVHPSRYRMIRMGVTRKEIEDKRNWYFKHSSHASEVSHVLQKNSQPLSSSEEFDPWEGQKLHSYTDGDPLDAMKMGLDLMSDVFGCKIRFLFVDGDKLSELFRLGISSVEGLMIFYDKDKPVNTTDLKYILENIKVIEKYTFHVEIPEDFHCDPQIFQCRHMAFSEKKSADWVTLDVLCQIDVPQFTFSYHRFTKEDIISYVTHWFNSESRKLEHIFFYFHKPITLEEFEIDHLSPMPFCEKRRSRCLFEEPYKDMDMSTSGMDILRQDGLLATFVVRLKYVRFYVWHKRFPEDAV